MEATAIRSDVIAGALKQMEESVSDLNGRITDLRSVTLGDDNAESASQTESMRGGDVELMNSLIDQMELIKADIDRVRDLDPAVHMDVVQYGAVVHTEKHHFLVGVSIEEFDVKGKKYLGVTTKAPLIQALSGAKKGETITFQEKNYVIKEVY